MPNEKISIYDAKMILGDEPPWEIRVGQPDTGLYKPLFKSYQAYRGQYSDYIVTKFEYPGGFIKTDLLDLAHPDVKTKGGESRLAPLTGLFKQLCVSMGANVDLVKKVGTEVNKDGSPNWKARAKSTRALVKWFDQSAGQRTAHVYYIAAEDLDDSEQRFLWPEEFGQVESGEREAPKPRNRNNRRAAKEDTSTADNPASFDNNDPGGNFDDETSASEHSGSEDQQGEEDDEFDFAFGDA